MRAILNQVILKPCEAKKVTEGGIILSEAHIQRSNKAVVVSAGNGTKKRPMIWEKGQTVYHVKGHGTEIEKDGEKFYIMDMDAIIAYH